MVPDWGDRIAPFANSSALSEHLVRNGRLKTHAGFPPAIPTTEAETISAALLELHPVLTVPMTGSP